MSNTLLIADTSLLINFLNVDRMDLIANHAPRCAVTEHVMAEVNGSFPVQKQRLDAALAAGHLEQVAASEDAELELFAKLQSGGRLGAGECSAIAVALNRGHALAIDDRLAIREARARATAMGITPSIYSTRDIIARLITSGHLTIGQADILLVEWRSQYRFELGITSFSELVC